LQNTSILAAMGIPINRIKVVLAENKKTNRWLAESLGKNEATVSRWCTNEAQPSVEMFFQVAKLLDVDIRELFNRTK
jgi:DNA-binding XRE family transcriptional regulator